jgi:hypothetical protein
MGILWFRATAWGVAAYLAVFSMVTSPAGFLQLGSCTRPGHACKLRSPARTTVLPVAGAGGDPYGAAFQGAAIFSRA